MDRLIFNETILYRSIMILDANLFNLIIVTVLFNLIITQICAQ